MFWNMAADTFGSERKFWVTVQPKIMAWGTRNVEGLADLYPQRALTNAVFQVTAPPFAPRSSDAARVRVSLAQAFRLRQFTCPLLPSPLIPPLLASPLCIWYAPLLCIWQVRQDALDYVNGIRQAVRRDSNKEIDFYRKTAGGSNKKQVDKFGLVVGRPIKFITQKAKDVAPTNMRFAVLEPVAVDDPLGAVWDAPVQAVDELATPELLAIADNMEYDPAAVAIRMPNECSQTYAFQETPRDCREDWPVGARNPFFDQCESTLLNLLALAKPCVASVGGGGECP
jgi:hypothetical protein